MILEVVNILAAVFSAWRITEVITTDRISESFRKRFPHYLWGCQRCVSVWASAVAVALFKFFPWANWPFAIAWLYIWWMDVATAKRLSERGRRLLVEIKDGVVSNFRNELSQAEGLEILNKVFNPPPPKP